MFMWKKTHCLVYIFMFGVNILSCLCLKCSQTVNIYIKDKCFACFSTYIFNIINVFVVLYHCANVEGNVSIVMQKIYIFSYTAKFFLQPIPYLLVWIESFNIHYVGNTHHILYFWHIVFVGLLSLSVTLFPSAGPTRAAPGTVVLWNLARSPYDKCNLVWGVLQVPKSISMVLCFVVQQSCLAERRI